MNFEQWCAAKGFDPVALSDAQRSSLMAMWKAEQPSVPVTTPAASSEPTQQPAQSAGTTASSPNSTFNDQMAAIEAEGHRQEYIRQRTVQAAQQYTSEPEKVRQLNELCAAALADQKTDTRAYDLALVRFDRSTGGPTVIISKEPQMTNEVIEAAVCVAAQLPSVETRFNEQTLDAAHKRFQGRMTLLRLVGICARQNGWRGDDVKSDLRNAMRFAFGWNGIQASVPGASTLAVSGILSNTANKFLKDAWNAVDQAWRQVSATNPVNDFKTITSYSMTGDLMYKKVAPGGEIQHGTLGNETYTNRADTFALILGIDRRDLINDDLGAFTKVPKRLGRGGALKFNEVFWTEFLADASTFYSAARGNYDDGADTAFDANGLTAADEIWQAKTDPDGKPLGLAAKILLVPPAHRIPAKRLMSSQETMKDSDLGSDNPWAGMFEVVSTPYLANSSFTGYSRLAWYMLCDPNELAVIESCFLNGAEMPTIEEVELAADHLGMGIRAYHDFGVSKQEYRAGLKLKGEA